MSKVSLPTKKHSDFFLSKNLATAFVTGMGGGKSYTLITRMIATKLQYPSIDLLYIAPTYSLIRDVLFPLIDEILGGTGVQYNINKADSDILFPNSGRIMCRSGDNPGRLIGMTVGDVFIDELDTMEPRKAEDIWNKCLGRMRAIFPDGKINQAWVATTPEGHRFVYKKFKKKPPEGYAIVQGSSHDNPYLPPGFIDAMRASYPPQLFEAYCNGKFCNLTSGAVYSYFDRYKHHTDRVIEKNDILLCSCDFNVMGSCVAVYVREKDKLYLVEEFAANDTRHMVEILNEKYPKHRIKMFPDSTAKRMTTNSNISDISMLKQAGFQINAKSVNPRILDRVNATNILFYNERIFINTKQCPEITEAFEQQVYDEKTGLPEKQHGPATVDDWIDGATYCPAFLFPIKKVNTTRRELF